MSTKVIQRVIERIQARKVPLQWGIPPINTIDEGFGLAFYRLRITDINALAYNRVYYHPTLQSLLSYYVPYRNFNLKGTLMVSVERVQLQGKQLAEFAAFCGISPSDTQALHSHLSDWNKVVQFAESQGRHEDTALHSDTLLVEYVSPRQTPDPIIEFLSHAGNN